MRYKTFISVDNSLVLITLGEKHILPERGIKPPIPANKRQIYPLITHTLPQLSAGFVHFSSGKAIIMQVFVCREGGHAISQAHLIKYRLTRRKINLKPITPSCHSLMSFSIQAGTWIIASTKDSQAQEAMGKGYYIKVLQTFA